MNKILEQMSEIEPVSLFIGMAIGICILTFIILFFRKKHKKIDLEKLKEKVLYINERIQMSQKYNIEAHKELNELYLIFNQLENSKK